MQLHKLEIAWLAFSLAAARLMQAAGTAGSDEPQHNGKPLSYWVLNGGGMSAYLSLPDLGDEGKRAVQSAGTNALPFLLQWINSPGAPLAFGALGAVACPAIPELLRLATNQPAQFAHGQTNVQLNATAALWRIGPNALPALCVIATNKGAAELRREALGAIVSMDTNAAAATSALLVCLKDENVELVSLALLALRRSGSKEQAVFDASLRSLESPSPSSLLKKGAF